MKNATPQVYVIAGPNGSGKTTSAKTLLPDLLNCNEYVNADSVAAALSPFNPDAVAIQAGRLMLERIHHLAERGVNFAFETTLASRTFVIFLDQCKARGYEVNILFLWCVRRILQFNVLIAVWSKEGMTFRKMLF